MLLILEKNLRMLEKFDIDFIKLENIYKIY